MARAMPHVTRTLITFSRKKRARKGPVEVTGQRPQALSTLRGAMKYIHTSARKYMAGIMVNNTA